MKLTDSTLLQVLLSPSNISALGNIRDNLLTRPASREDVGFGIRKTPLQVGNIASICALLSQVVGIL